MEPLTIGRLARLAGVGVETIRFYERQGLVPRPPRTAAGYRQYPAGTLERLRFIQRAKELGFSLREVDELISLRLAPATCGADVRARAEAKVRDIEGKIGDLQRMRAALLELVQACAERGAAGECPILRAMEPVEAG